MASLLLFSSCDEDVAVRQDKIDKTTEDVKNIIDVLSGAAKEIAKDENGKLKELKEKLKEMGEKSKDLGVILEKEGKDLGKILESIKDDPKVKEAIERLGENSEKIIKDLEESVKDIEINTEKNKE